MFLPITRRKELADIKEILNVVNGLAMNQAQITQLLYGLTNRVNSATENKQDVNHEELSRDDYHGVEYG